jgi:excisionase family DNA binding protein
MMEKFCIVKRRRMTPVSEQVQESAAVNDAGVGLRGEAGLPSYGQPGPVKAVVTNRLSTDDVVDSPASGQMVRILLTPEQCRIMNQGDAEGSLFGRIVGDASADVGRDEEGRIVLNLHLKYAYGTRMLTGPAVGEMLQISRGMVARLVRDGRLKSYKIGRLRRFLLEDVLEYISRNTELKGLITAEPT